ncbi:MAG: hypothetical protein MUE65_04755 [Methanomassiliicoccales archaeon]|nr:hypothetical protein [Methanomassiliicoccales archaeon]
MRPLRLCAVPRLYVYARFLDLKEKEGLDRPLLVTNTRFTSDVERYARCVGMEVLGWGVPQGQGLEQLATVHRIFPVTMLEMRRSDQVTLLAHKFITIDDVLARKRDLSTLLSRESAQDIERQAREVLGQ